MIFSLASYAVENGYRVESFERVDSTNLLAAEFARNGDAGKLWVVAGEQTAGRARRGRGWISTAGNLYASLLLADAFDISKVATLSFVAGVSVVEGIGRLLPQASAVPSLQLKWPNDVLLDGAKLAGILLELVPLSDGRNGVIIGIGMNVVHAPEGMPYPTASLQKAGLPCSPAEVFSVLSHCWVDNYRLWNNGAGLAAIREKWLRYAANLGGPVHVMVNDQMISGVFETIDDDGRFVIRQDNGQRTVIPAGDVHFGSVASVHKQAQ